MDILNMFNPSACSIDGAGSINWTWDEYFQKKEELGDQIVLVDMIRQPLPGSVPIDNQLFNNKHPKGRIFVLYCHSGGSSGSLQKKLTPYYPEYTFVNLKGGIGAYPR